MKVRSSGVFAFFVAVSVLFLSPAVVSATNWEFSLSYEDIFKSSETISVGTTLKGLGPEDLSCSVKTPKSVKGSSCLFFVSPLAFDLGIGVNGSYSLYNSLTLDNVSYDLQSGWGASVGAGPVLRVNLGSRNSLFFFPSAQFMLRKFDVGRDSLTNTDRKFEERILGYNVNLGYRLWLIKKSSFLVGLNAGLDFSSGTRSFCTFRYGDNESGSYKVKDLTALDFYLGLSFNFGKRGVDSAKASE